MSFPPLNSVSSGRAVIKAPHDIFQERTKAVRMTVAALAERGFEVCGCGVDCQFINSFPPPPRSPLGWKNNKYLAKSI